MNGTTQLKAHLRKLAKSKNVKADVLLRLYLFERILRRISISRYKNNFIIKGGLLIASLVGVEVRSTKDLDATLKGMDHTESDIVDYFDEIFSRDVQDQCEFSLLAIEEIRQTDEYPGFRVTVQANLGVINEHLKIDLTTGDEITPKETEYGYPTLFGDEEIAITTYSIESIFAEKFETVIARGVLNTRMRDFYDIHILIKLNSVPIDILNLTKAIDNTCAKRNTLLQLQNANAVVAEIAKNQNLEELWKRYSAANTYVEGISWADVIESVEKLVSLYQKGTEV